MNIRKNYYDKPNHPLAKQLLLSKCQIPQQSNYSKFTNNQITNVCRMKIDDFPRGHQGCLKCLELNMRRKRLFCYEVHRHSPQFYQKRRSSSKIVKSKATKQSSNLDRNIQINQFNIENVKVMNKINRMTPQFKRLNPNQQKLMYTTNSKRNSSKKFIALPKSIHQLEPCPKIDSKSIIMSFSDKN